VLLIGDMPDRRGSTPSLLLALVAVFAAAACTAAPRDTRRDLGTVRIGLLAPLSGQDAAAGAAAVHGAELAAALVDGESGAVRPADLGLRGLARGTLKIVPADAANSPERAHATDRPDSAVGAAVRLVEQQGVVGLVGAYDADVTAAASQRTERLGVPFVNGDSAAGYLTERGLDWFFRVGPTDRLLGEAAFSVLRQQAAAGAATRRIGLLYADDPASNGAAAAVRALAGEAGQDVVPPGGVSFAPGTPDLTAAVQQVRSQRPDALFLVAASGSDAQALTRALGKAGGRPPATFALGAGFLQPATLTAAGPAGEGLLYGTGWTPPAVGRNPTAKVVMDLYQKRYHAPMDEVAAGTFTAVLTLATAIDAAGSVDPQRVRAALLSLDVPGRSTIMPWDGIRFDATTHQNVRATGVVERRAGGAFQVVFPPELGPAA
jgi:branched-chain amino acid transport system substrate-binding protein